MGSACSDVCKGESAILNNHLYPQLGTKNFYPKFVEKLKQVQELTFIDSLQSQIKQSIIEKGKPSVIESATGKKIFKFGYPYYGYIVKNEADLKRSVLKGANKKYVGEDFDGECQVFKLDQGMSQSENDDQFVAYYKGKIKFGEAIDSKAFFLTQKGIQYEGAVDRSKASGQGDFIMFDPDHREIVYRYSGSWHNDKMVGKGIEQDHDLIYQGEFKDGKKSGAGQLRDVAGTFKYAGKFADDQFNGKGVLQLSKEYVYDGNFKDGKKSGFGTWKGEHNNETYAGNFLDNMKHGKGKYTFRDQDVYEGNFVKDKPHGEGKLITSDKVITGAWFNGKMITKISEEVKIS